MLTAESLAKIDIELKKYPTQHKRSAIMSALRIAQEEKGWLSTEMIAFIARYLGLPEIAAYEVATFYSMYNLKPVGRYKLTICTNLPCALSGGNEAANYLKSKLGIDFGQTTADGQFTLQQGECMGACGYAPVILINHSKICKHMTPAEIDKKLVELTK